MRYNESQEIIRRIESGDNEKIRDVVVGSEACMNPV